MATNIFNGGQVGYPNGGLRPETTFAYNLGADHRSSTVRCSPSILFSTRSTTFSPRASHRSTAASGGYPRVRFSATSSRQSSIAVNAPLERHYGLEVSFTRVALTGLGYRLNATLQRAFLDQLPASFFGSSSNLVNGKQLDGSTSVPYTQAYGEINFRHRSGIAVAVGADYTGANNWTNGPAFLTWSSMLRYNTRGGYRAQFSIENMFDQRSGDKYAASTANGGFESVTYGSPVRGGLPVFGATPTTRYAIAPRTFRFQVETHFGR